MDFTEHVIDRKKTSQRKKVPDVKKQKRNNAGGIAFKMKKWDYLKRFLILGTENGTYYVDQKKLTADALKNVQKCIDSDGIKAVKMIVKISVAGRAADNDFAIYALAMAASAKSRETRRYALQEMHKVCRIGTHLFHFVSYVKGMRGFGRGLREALARWYTEKETKELSYQLLKYQGRDGWTHRDVIRLAHPVPADDRMDGLFAYATGNTSIIPHVSMYASGAHHIRLAGNASEASEFIKKYSLTREVVPTQFMNSKEVWEAMFEKMPMMAMLRNLGKMASLGMHQSFSLIEKETCRRLTDETIVKRSRLHPIAIMNALLVYRSGRGFKGSLSWTPSGKVIDALEQCFYLSFKNVKPTGKNIMLALDVSGSMTQQLNRSFMSCRVASAVLAMVTMRTEEHTDIIGFTDVGKDSYSVNSGDRMWGGCRNSVARLPLSKNANFDTVCREVSGLPFSRTDCALPMTYCEKKNLDVDAICIYTDNETYSGGIHPWQALDSLQQKLGHEVRCIVVGMTSTQFSIARPEYKNMLDVVGFDTNTPSIISDFIRD